jgi:N6-L-threonylcarbamoyladenine synthase
MKKSYILGIETSCDETAASVMTLDGRLLSNTVYSQIDLHKEYGGIVPEIASRDHAVKIHEVVKKCLEEANIKPCDLSYVAFTNGPGLLGCLLVGVSFAKALFLSRKIPLIPVDHVKAHLMSVFIEKRAQEKLRYPFIGMVVSGGHTSIYVVKSFSDVKLFSSTIDDAAGEAFDKVSRFLGLGYPGGKIISEISEKGDENFLKLKKPKIKNNLNDFSFSGVKTFFINKFREFKGNIDLESKEIKNIIASFQKTVVEILVDKLIYAAKENDINDIVIGGGVAANKRLRKVLEERCKENAFNSWLIPLSYCTDNAAMIANYARLKIMDEGKIEYEDSLINIKPYSTTRKR